jgi:hypothetical protein
MDHRGRVPKAHGPFYFPRVASVNTLKAIWLASGFGVLGVLRFFLDFFFFAILRVSHKGWPLARAGQTLTVPVPKIAIVGSISDLRLTRPLRLRNRNLAAIGCLEADSLRVVSDAQQSHKRQRIQSKIKLNKAALSKSPPLRRFSLIRWNKVCSETFDGVRR